MIKYFSVFVGESLIGQKYNYTERAFSLLLINANVLLMVDTIKAIAGLRELF